MKIQEKRKEKRRGLQVTLLSNTDPNFTWADHGRNAKIVSRDTANTNA